MTHRGEPTQAYDFDEENSNTSANPTFDSVLGARLSRRGLLRGGVATAGTAVLITLAARLGDPWKVVAFSIYGAMLVLLYAASTAYHSVRARKPKAVLQKLDHCSIYLLIAGSYTPFALVSLRGAWGWSLLGVVWGLAALGVVQEIWLARGARILSLVLYVAMGWLALFALKPMVAQMAMSGLLWLVIGGLSYTLGAVVFMLDNRVRYAHFVWHLFVLGGSTCHFFAALWHAQ